MGTIVTGTTFEVMTTITEVQNTETQTTEARTTMVQAIKVQTEVQDIVNWMTIARNLQAGDTATAFPEYIV